MATTVSTASAACRAASGWYDLIRGPGGEKLIEYMTTAAGGKELGKQLSQDPNGANFNAPTGRIYTVPDLLKYLKQQYDAQHKA